MSSNPVAATGPSNPTPPWRRWALRTARVVIPVGIVILILRQVDLGVLWGLAQDATAWLVALGLAFMPSRILFAVLRWWQLLRAVFEPRVRYRRALRHYWAGVSLGFFTPGSAGLEVYRVAAVSRETGNVRTHVGLVAVEKMLALAGCAVLVLAAVPFLPQTASDAERPLQQLVGMAAMLLLLMMVSIPVLAFVLRTRLLARVARWTDRSIQALRERWDVSVEREEALDASLRSALKPVPLGAAFAWSVLLQLSSAVGAQIMFRAVGYELDFSVNVFIMPLLYLLFALPISVGSLGVREGAFIVLYGLFGVPAEVALLVSLLNLAGLMMNNVIGAIMLALAPSQPTRSGEQAG